MSSCRGVPGAWRGAAGNISWAAVKLTELEPGGTRYVNPDAAADWTWLRRNGKYRIAYVFGHPSVSAAETVDYFLAELGKLGLSPATAWRSTRRSLTAVPRPKSVPGRWP